MEGEKDSGKNMLGELGVRDLVLGVDTIGLGILTAYFVSTTRRLESELEQLRDENAGLNERIMEIETQDLSKKNIDTALKAMGIDITRQGKRLAIVETKITNNNVITSKPKVQSSKKKPKAYTPPPSSSSSSSQEETDVMVDDSSIFDEMD